MELSNGMNSNMLLLENRMKGCYQIMEEIRGEHFVLDYQGDLLYGECFGEVDKNSIFAKQNYKKVTPYRIVKIGGFFIMECFEYSSGIFRGTELMKNKYEYDVFSESLEEILDSI